jgi:spore coat protein U-like protein
MNKASTTRSIALAVGAATAVAASTALAGSVPQTVNVTANVQSTCNASGSVTDIAFGTIAAFLAAPTPPAVGNFSLQCNKGATVNVVISNGANFGLGASGSLRAMKSGSDYISYHIYTPTNAAFSNCAGASTDWPGAPGVNVSTLWAGSGGPNTISLCGVVDAAPAGGYAVGASYSDTVTVTANF